ncbi:MAG: flavodoxin [Malacoplasma sp.]|nr:flavodoxin [Malacoplasma sp.]MDE7075466.1 flavodoxin [Malacoplasma sp.]
MHSNKSNVLIVYFSCSNRTEKIAQIIQRKTKGLLFKIIPQQPYTDKDLEYYTDNRADKEQADYSCRPAIKNSVIDFQNYDVVFLGYPIWQGEAPKIILTFLESYDFSKKVIIPFCTSHSSGIGDSDVNLHIAAKPKKWVKGKRFSSHESEKTIFEWIESLDF